MFPELQSTYNSPAPTRRLIRDLPETEQPQYRAKLAGPGALSTLELLALVIARPDGLDLAGEILAHPHPKPDNLPIGQLTQFKGIGEKTAVRIKAAIELGKRLYVARLSPADPPKILSPQDAAAMLMPQLVKLEQEHFIVISLDTRNQVLDIHTLYIGTVNSTSLLVAEVFKRPIMLHAPAIIIAHNHPSGDPSPSPEDIGATRKIVQGGKTLDIEVLDHMIIGAGRFTSLKERGLGFFD